MKRYYWESKTAYGSFNEEDDEAAVKSALKDIPGEIRTVYRESDSKDGLPFVILYDKKEDVLKGG